MKHVEFFTTIQRHIELWDGYAILALAMERFDDLQVYVAGGVVRNSLMGITSPPKDFDFFLQGSSTAAAIHLFGKHGCLQTTPYGSPRWYPPNGVKQYVDLISISDFTPGLWPCENIVDVLNQFDFTANAVACDLRTGRFFDPQNGVRDAERHLMKMVRFDYPNGPYVPSGSMDRNAVLWFRVVHYASTLDLKIDPLTKKWITDHSYYKNHLAEFTKIFFNPKLCALEGMHEK